MCRRIRIAIAAPAVLLGMAVHGIGPTPVAAQDPTDESHWSPQMIRDSGRPIAPVFEGWFPNEDGTYTLHFLVPGTSSAPLRSPAAKQSLPPDQRTQALIELATHSLETRRRPR